MDYHESNPKTTRVQYQEQVVASNYCRKLQLVRHHNDILNDLLHVNPMLIALLQNLRELFSELIINGELMPIE